MLEHEFKDSSYPLGPHQAFAVPKLNLYDRMSMDLPSRK